MGCGGGGGGGGGAVDGAGAAAALKLQVMQLECAARPHYCRNTGCCGELVVGQTQEMRRNSDGTAGCGDHLGLAERPRHHCSDRCECAGREEDSSHKEEE